MPRKILVPTDRFPYHLTARVNNRELFPIRLPEVWKILSRNAYAAHTIHELNFHAVVLMPNHIHMLASTPKKNLSQAMQSFMSCLTKELTQEGQRTGRIFERRYYWSVIENLFYFSNALKYVYRNPVRAGLCDKVQQYEFSTLHSLIGQSHSWIPVSPPPGQRSILPGGLIEGEILDWLNSSFQKDIEERIRQGLRRRTFNPKMKNWKRSLDQLARDLV